MAKSVARGWFALAVAFALAGCVNQNTWSPTVDPYTDPNAARLGIDEAQCRQIANQSAGSSLQQTGKGALIGGLLGAAAGAAIGAAAHDPGMGAAIGAAAGGFGGGAYEGTKSNQSFQQVFTNCMRERGHKVLN
jgi:outer membrane lipoprotein SlyB